MCRGGRGVTLCMCVCMGGGQHCVCVRRAALCVGGGGGNTMCVRRGQHYACLILRFLFHLN